MRDALRTIGVPRLLIVAFLAAIWIVAAVKTTLDLEILLVNSIVRSAMNGVLVLALVPMVRAGAGLNFGLPVGIVCGLVGAVVALDRGLAGWTALAASMAIAIPLGAVAGVVYALLLERVRGQEMMVGLYVGFGAVALMSIVWLIAPFSHPEVIMPIGGSGARSTLRLSSALVAGGDRVTWSDAGRMLAVWLGAALLLAVFHRTRAGVAVAAAGANERFAITAGIPVARMRRLGVILSTTLAAAGIIVFSHGLGLIQLYKAPLFMALPAVAALLLGGATTARATVLHAIVGTLLFQTLVTISSPVMNELAQASGTTALRDAPEVARLIIGNGVILYALTRRG